MSSSPPQDGGYMDGGYGYGGYMDGGYMDGGSAAYMVSCRLSQSV